MQARQRCSEARSQDAIVGAGEEQRDAEAEGGDAVAEASGLALDLSRWRRRRRS